MKIDAGEIQTLDLHGDGLEVSRDAIAKIKFLRGESRK